MLNHQASIDLLQQQRSQKKSQFKDEITSLEKQLKEQSASLQNDINQLLVAIEADQSRIDLLDDDKLKYDDDDAASFQLQADNASRYQQALNDVNEIIEAFEGNLNKVQAKFESLLQSLTLQKVKDEARNNEQVATVKEQANVQLSVIAETYQSQLSKLNEQLNNNFLKLSMDSQTLQNQLKMVEIEQGNIQLETELQTEINLNQANMSEAKDNLSQLLQALSTDNELVNDLEKKRNTLLDRHKQENRQLENNKHLQQQLQLQLLPETGSLQYFLDNEENARGWKNNIGKVLSCEDLARKDLNPRWVNQQGESSNLFGLQFDLEQLKNHDLQLNENDLRERLADVEHKITTLSKHIETFEAELNELNKQIKNQQELISDRKQKLQKAQLQREQLTTQSARSNSMKQS